MVRPSFTMANDIPKKRTATNGSVAAKKAKSKTVICVTTPL